MDRDDMLDLVGLQAQRSTGDRLVTGLALFGAGVLVGVGVGLMLAPKPGAALRDDLKARLQGATGPTPPAPAVATPGAVGAPGQKPA